MGARADDRLRGGLLAGLAVAALVAGGWWWRYAAPATGPVPAAVSSAPATSAPPPAARRVLIDPEDGHIIQGPEAYLDEALVFHQESGAPNATLVSHTVWEDTSHLTKSDRPLIRQTSPSAGERYLLVVGCAGAGTLTVAFSGSGDEGSGRRVTCAELPLTVTLTAAGGPLQVRFTVADGEVDLDARLSALF
ncbi:hypothetical protein [Micromonospora sp. IBHARD004]|uniref:hypothetical protein n=1 Tax=Micromonospora sp. IBHARD004 TaxID=3457764 RepID=UPI004058E276